MNLYKVVIGSKTKEGVEKVNHNLYVVDDNENSAMILAENSFGVIAEKLGLQILRLVQLDEIITDGQFKDRLLIQYRKIMDKIDFNDEV